MGSTAISTNQSSTAYTNAPITQSDVTNPVNLTNASNVKVGSSETNTNLNLATGSNYTNTSLDGGAISKAFEFVTHFADMTRATNATLGNNSGAGVQAAVAGVTTQPVTEKLLQNKTLIYAAVAVAAAWFFFARK